MVVKNEKANVNSLTQWN